MSHIAKKRFLFVALLVAVLVAALPTVVYADPGNGKAKGHTKVEVNQPASGNQGKGSDNKVGPLGGGNPTPTPAPTTAAKVYRDKYDYSDSDTYGCYNYQWSGEGRYHAVYNRNAVNRVTEMSGQSKTVNICTGEITYEGTFTDKVHTVWDYRLNKWRLVKETFGWTSTYNGVTYDNVVQYTLDDRGWVVVKHWWVNQKKV